MSARIAVPTPTFVRRAFQDAPEVKRACRCEALSFAAARRLNVGERGSRVAAAFSRSIVLNQVISKYPPNHSFRIYYRGNLADDGMLEAAAFATSLLGAARLYGLLAHYSELGYMPRKRKKFEVYTRAAISGKSVDQELILQSITHSDLITGGIVGIVVKELVASVIRWCTRPDDRGRAQQELGIILEQHRSLVHITDRLLDANERLVDRLPKAAEEARPHLESLVSPLKQASCESIVQFPDDKEQIVLTPEDVDAIQEDAVRTEKTHAFRISRIRRLNTQTGNCSVVVNDDDWDIHRVVFGEIDDPSLELPNNKYTRVMYQHSPATVIAEADIRNDYVVRLYIKDILVEE